MLWKSNKYYMFRVYVCVCVCVALVIQHAKCMRRIVFSVAFLAVPHFSTLSHRRHDFRKKNIGSTYSFWSFGSFEKAVGSIQDISLWVKERTCRVGSATNCGTDFSLLSFRYLRATIASLVTSERLFLLRWPKAVTAAELQTLHCVT